MEADLWRKALGRRKKIMINGHLESYDRPGELREIRHRHTKICA
jgi:hypothetical protein